ncbi:UDP-3-O-acyl-N-acetylglucosamine deacetylase [Acidomonas methanolica]|uniref:UDP-3-O-acyl-N-acetylglucosamine deacetylase n=1 Tax=Acidomonas methanolica TaxID=437 RepID=UPI00211A0A4D|nr:UDP-3-O-acyl-N-acetylglucosamine deacetylase [Acidomonas methanolica]MCQ9156064.1 UDP-3-O-acyl-N-acetylglucosamine deacetylase [Acidomonas methanolica]
MQSLTVCEAPAPAADGTVPGSTGAARQRTLANPISCTGIGLHSGMKVRLSFLPAPAGHGIAFRRSDLPGAPVIPALYDHVVDTRLSTVLGDAAHPAIRVATVEHVMAALSGNGIDNALLDIDGPEMPILDGSAAEFDFLICCAGRVEQDAPRRRIEILRPVRVEGEDGAFAELRPAKHGMLLAFSIDFAAPAIGRQAHVMLLTEQRFRQEVANCRTFVERRDIEALKKLGLARGGSLENAIVVEEDRILNPGGLRRSGEFVRHKMMDAIGDLYLAGHRLQARFIGHKSGHCLNNRLLRAVLADSANWRLSASPLPDSVLRVAA